MELIDESTWASTLAEEAGAVAPAEGTRGRATGRGDAPPPASNTGGRLTDPEGREVGRVKIDWLSLTFPWEVRELVVEQVSAVMGAGELTQQGMNFYHSSWRWESGAVLAFNEDGSGPRRKDGSSTCSLILSGSVVDWFTAEQLQTFMRWSWQQGASCTRLDAAFDDFTRKILVLANVHAAAAAGDFAGFKVHRSDQVLTRRGVLKGDGHTFGLRGRMGSGRVVQFYDKTLESKGEIDAIRMEVRYAKEHAQAAFLQLVVAADLDGFTSQLCGIIGGSIRFLDRSDGETHLPRCAPLPWWSAVLELLSSCRVVVTRKAPPLQRSLEYLRDTWALNLALFFELAESAGRDGNEALRLLMRRMVAKGRAKLDAGKRPGAKSFQLDFESLLCA